jgi:membrane-associated protein
MISNLLNVNHLVSTYSYVGIFLIVFIESGIFFFLPGDSLLFAAGLFAATGHLNLIYIIVLAFVAGYLGNIVGYEIGTHLKKLRQYAFFRKLIKDEHMSWAEDFFNRRGHLAVFMARFIPAARTFVPWVAGAALMRKSVFYTWSGIGAVLWVLIMTFAGYFLGKAFPGIDKYLTEAILIIILLSILPGIFGYWRHRRSKAEK